MNYITKQEGIRFINKMLNKKIRDFYVYNKLVSKELNIKRNIPIYIDKDVLFLPTKAYKAYDCMWINFNEIKKYEIHDKYILIYFHNLESIMFLMGKKKFERILKDCQKVRELFEKINEKE